MDVTTAKKIRSAVIKDDVKSLKNLLVSKECFALSFGRFPLLSLAYLYGANKVVYHYEHALNEVDGYVVVDEEPEDYLLFKKKAGKSLRLYLGGQTITPVEMASIVGDSLTVNAHVKKAQNTDRVKKIYKLTHAQEVKKNGNSIIVPRSKKPKNQQIVAVITIIAVCLVCLIGGVVSLEIVPSALGGEGTSSSPLHITSPELFETALGDTSNRYYSLSNDVTIDAAAWKKSDFSINLDGGGNVITIEGARNSSLIAKLSGSLSNATVKFVNVGNALPANGALLANEVTGKIQNVDFYVEDFNLTATTECGLIAHTSTGTISNVKVFANGIINEVSALEETVIGTLLYKNAGIVSDVEASIDISLSGDAKAATDEDTAAAFGDAVFGGVIGLNNGTLTRVTITEGSSITSDTLDLAGICAVNAARATITNAVNNADLTQSTLTSYWSPSIGGITMRNSGKISSSDNNGNLTATTNQNKQNTSIIIGGITTANAGSIENATNTGTITGTMLAGALNLGGIGYLNEGTTTNATNFGAIVATVTETESYALEHSVAGAYAVNNGSISKIKNNGNIIGSFSVESIAYVGGLVGQNYSTSATIDKCQNNGNITVATPQENNKRVFVGGISAYLLGTLNDSFNTGSFGTASSEKAVVAGAIFGFTRVQEDIMGTMYKSYSDWGNNRYVSGLGYEVGIGLFYVEGIFGKSYVDGEDIDTTPTDIDTLKTWEGYWQ